MKRFDKIVEQWASIYKPMQHQVVANRRFFEFDSIVSIPQFTGQLDRNKTPSVGFEFHKEGNIDHGKIRPVYTIYFLVNVGTDSPTDKDAAADAVSEAESHALKFIAWLMSEQEKCNPDVRGIDLSNVQYGTYGPLLNNWYAYFLQLRDTEPFNTCVDKNDYLPSPTE